MKVVFTPQAREDLREIREYISGTLKNPQASDRITNNIIRSCQRLSLFPNMGVSLQGKIGRETNYLCLFCENYIIFYTAENSQVRISRILDGRTDCLKIIF